MPYGEWKDRFKAKPARWRRWNEVMAEKEDRNKGRAPNFIAELAGLTCMLCQIWSWSIHLVASFVSSTNVFGSPIRLRMRQREATPCSPTNLWATIGSLGTQITSIVIHTCPIWAMKRRARAERGRQYQRQVRRKFLYFHEICARIR